MKRPHVRAQDTADIFLLAERAGFEPAIPGYGIPLFESGAFSHSATSPEGGFEYISGQLAPEPAAAPMSRKPPHCAHIPP